MRIAVIGTDTFTLRCADVIASRADVACLISMTPDGRPNNSADTQAYANSHKMPYQEFDDINSAQAVSWLGNFEFEYMLSCWPKMMHAGVLATPKRFVIGTHPTTLPFNRGRHPLHWMIAMGIEHSHVSFFKMDEGVDSGPILHQEPFSISSMDTVADAVEAMDKAAVLGLETLLGKLLEDGAYSGVTQNASLANVWRCRTPADVTLDPRLSVDAICRIVRSFTSPYPCALLKIEDRDYRVISATPCVHDDEAAVQRMEHGRVLSSTDNHLVMKADDGLVSLYLDQPWNKVASNGKQIKHIHPPLFYAGKVSG